MRRGTAAAARVPTRLLEEQDGDVRREGISRALVGPDGDRWSPASSARSGTSGQGDRTADRNGSQAANLDVHAARKAGALVMTRDTDFAALVHQFGAPPQIVLVTCGNTSNAHLWQVLGTAWPTVALMLERGEPLVEIGDRPR